MEGAGVVDVIGGDVTLVGEWQIDAAQRQHVLAARRRRSAPVVGRQKNYREGCPRSVADGF